MALHCDKGDLGLRAKQLHACSVQPVICFNKRASQCGILSVAALILGDLGFLDGLCSPWSLNMLWGNAGFHNQRVHSRKCLHFIQWAARKGFC